MLFIVTKDLAGNEKWSHLWGATCFEHFQDPFFKRETVMGSYLLKGNRFEILPSYTSGAASLRLPLVEVRVKRLSDEDAQNLDIIQYARQVPARRTPPQGPRSPKKFLGLLPGS